MIAEELAQCLMKLFESPIKCIIWACVKNQQHETEPLERKSGDERETITKLNSLYDDFIRNNDLLLTNNASEELLNKNQEQIRLESEREEMKRKLKCSQSQLKAANDELMKTKELLHAEKVLRSKVETEGEWFACLAEKLQLILLKYDRRFSSAHKTVAIDTLTNNKLTAESDVVVTGNETDTNCRVLEISSSSSPENIANNNTPGIGRDTDDLMSSENENSSCAIHKQPSMFEGTSVNDSDANVMIYPKTNASDELHFGWDFCGVSFSRKTRLRKYLQKHMDNQSFDRSQFITVEKIAEGASQMSACKPLALNDNPWESREGRQSTIDTSLLKPEVCVWDICQKYFFSEHSLDEHKRSGQIEETHRDKRNKILPQKEPLKRHEATHDSQKPFQCSICEKRFKAAIIRNRHVQETHQGDEFGCSYCNRKYSNKRTLKIHIMTKHLPASERPYECAICGKSFVRKYWLDQHHFIHTLERPHKCGICNKTFALKKYLRLHNATHSSQRPYQCSICEKWFKTAINRRNHIRNIHEGAGYWCSYCNRKFNQKCNLGRHITTLHLPASLKSKYTLKQHQSVHSTEGSHKCSICNAPFTLEETLKRHEAAHIPQTSFQSPICDNYFKTADRRNTRGRVIHEFLCSYLAALEKPHKCATCDKSFARKQTLEEHQSVQI